MLRFRCVLFPTDFSPCAEHAFLHAAYLAERSGATLHVLHVAEGEAEAPDDWAAGLRITPDDVAADLGLPLAPRPEPSPGFVPIVEAEVSAEEPAPAILRYAERHGVDLVVMGTHGRSGVDRLVMGSVAEEVLRGARCPVFTVREMDRHDGTAARQVLAALDLSEHALPVARRAAALAAAYEGTLTLLHVVDPAVMPTATVPFLGDFYVSTATVGRRAEEVLGEMAATLREEVPALGHVGTVVRIGHPTLVIHEVAQERCADVLVLGSHGRRGVNRMLLGSVAERVIRSAPCPVLTVRGVSSRARRRTRERTLAHGEGA